MGCSTICIKDMAGVITPAETEALIKGIKDTIPEMPVVLHTHCTTGMAYMSILMAAQCGCDVIDTAVSSFSGGTSQPATETINIALKELGYPNYVSVECGCWGADRAAALTAAVELLRRQWDEA